jgi:hypothetical protein
MFSRIALVVTAALVAGTVYAPAAFATSSIPAPPEEGAVLVSETVKTGLGAVTEALGAIDGVKVGRERAVLSVREGDAVRPITMDYGEVLGGDGRASGLGYAAGAYLGLGLLTRIMRLLRMGAALLGR